MHKSNPNPLDLVKVAKSRFKSKSGFGFARHCYKFKSYHSYLTHRKVCGSQRREGVTWEGGRCILSIINVMCKMFRLLLVTFLYSLFLKTKPKSLGISWFSTFLIFFQKVGVFLVSSPDNVGLAKPNKKRDGEMNTHTTERNSLPSKNFPCISMDMLQIGAWYY